MLLVADKTQNIYGTAAAWTERAMTEAGFRGPWAELKTSYRLAPSCIPLVRRFAEEFLAEEEVDLPEVEDQKALEIYPVELRWVQTENNHDVVNVCFSEVRRMMQRLRADTAVSDIVLLSGNRTGLRLVEMLESRGISVLHTFDPDKTTARRQKRWFYKGSAQIKATTPHSFKGWESRHLLLLVEGIENGDQLAFVRRRKMACQ